MLDVECIMCCFHIYQLKSPFSKGYFFVQGVKTETLQVLVYGYKKYIMELILFADFLIN